MKEFYNYKNGARETEDRTNNNGDHQNMLKSLDRRIGYKSISVEGMSDTFLTKRSFLVG